MIFFLPLFILLHLNTYADSFPVCSLLAFSGEFKRCSPQLGREPVIMAFAGKRSLDLVSAGTQPANRKEEFILYYATGFCGNDKRIIIHCISRLQAQY